MDESRRRISALSTSFDNGASLLALTRVLVRSATKNEPERHAIELYKCGTFGRHRARVPVSFYQRVGLPSPCTYNALNRPQRCIALCPPGKRVVDNRRIRTRKRRGATLAD